MTGAHDRQTELLVAISSWEIECCGPLPTVGQPASWRLVFMPVDTPDPESSERDPGVVADLHWHVEPLPDSPHGRALDRNGFAAYYTPASWAPGGQTQPLPKLGRQRLRGTVFGTRHGGAEWDGFPTVTAMTGRIQVVSWVHCEVKRTLARVPGSARLRDVDESPKWFRYEPRPDCKAVRQLDNPTYRDETGLLLTLLDDTG